MADNITVTPGTGITVATDDVGGVQYQRVKIGIGADGVATDLAYGQQTKSASLPVALASDHNGQTTKSASLPVTIATDHFGQQVKASSFPVTFATEHFGQQTKSASLPVTLATDQGTLAVNQVTSGYDVAVTVTRPANVTAYTANDSVGGAITFATVGPSGASIMITGVQLEIDISAIPSGMTSFRLYLYNVTPPSAYADNAAWDLPSGDRASFLGYVDIGSPVDLGSTCYVETFNINKQLKLSSGNLYGYLVTTGGFTPAANSEVYVVTLHTVSV